MAALVRSRLPMPPTNWVPLNPSPLMIGLPSDVSCILYKLGLRRRCCHLCGSRSHDVKGCSEGDPSSRFSANTVYYRFWTFQVSEELRNFAFSGDNYLAEARARGRTHYIPFSTIKAFVFLLDTANKELKDANEKACTSSASVVFNVGSSSVTSKVNQRQLSARQPLVSNCHPATNPASESKPAARSFQVSQKRPKGRPKGSAQTGQPINPSPHSQLDLHPSTPTSASAPSQKFDGNFRAVLGNATSKSQQHQPRPPKPLQGDVEFQDFDGRQYAPSANTVRKAVRAPRQGVIYPSMASPSASPATKHVRTNSAPGARIVYKNLDSWTLETFKSSGQGASDYFWSHAPDDACYRMSLALQALPVVHPTRLQAEVHWRYVLENYVPVTPPLPREPNEINEQYINGNIEHPPSGGPSAAALGNECQE